MKAASIRLVGQRQRDHACDLVRQAPDGHIVAIKEPTRSLEQNAHLWSLLQDISRAEPLGRKHTPDDWKAIAMNACGWDCQFVEGLDGRPFPLGFRSSRMTVAQMSTLIDWLYAFGSENGVRWSDG